MAFHHCNDAKFDLSCPLCRTWEKCFTPWSWVWVAFWPEEDTWIRFLWLKSSLPSLTSIWSRRWVLLGEAIAKGNWGIAVDVMEGSKLVDKSSATRSASFQNTSWRGVSDLRENKKGSNVHEQQDKKQTAALYLRQLFYFGQIFFLQEAVEEIKRNKKVSFCLRSPVYPQGERSEHRLRLAGKYSKSWVNTLPNISYMTLEGIPMPWIKIGWRN